MLELTPLLLAVLIFCSITFTFFIANGVELMAMSGNNTERHVNVCGSFVSFICRWYAALCLLAFLIYAFFTVPTADSSVSGGFPGWAFVYSKCASIVEAAHSNHALWYILPFFLSLFALYVFYRSGLALKRNEAF